MKIRDYQEAAVDSIFHYFESGGQGNPLVAMPTGTGKSIVIGEFLQRVFKAYPGQRIIKLTHVKELIAQNYDKLRRIWPRAPAGIYSSGLKKWESQYPITFAGIASVVRSPELFGHIDLAIIDEAHLVSPKEGTMYQAFLGKLRQKNPLLKVIGLTATHYRLGQGLLTEQDGLFTDIVFDMTGLEPFNWLITEGYLAPLIPRRTDSELDVSGVRTHAGEFVQKELQEAVDKADITYATLLETIQLGHDRKHWLIFAAGVNHAIHVRDMLNGLNIPTTCVHSRMADKERDRSIADYKAGKYRAMVNNGILTTGFDFPEMDLIVMLRPTQSPGLWVQMLGRGTRPVYAPGFDLDTREGRMAAQMAGPKRNCLVLDFAGNTRRLGPINDPIVPKRKGSRGGGHAPIKTCEHCGCYNHTSARFCINCGAEFHYEVKITTGASTDELIAKAMPHVSHFDVDRITYQRHRKIGRPDSLRVTYYSGLRRFDEWICFEHEGYARRKAHDWWKERCQDGRPIPLTVSEVLTRAEGLRIPSTIRVWANKQPPEILGYDYK